MRGLARTLGAAQAGADQPRSLVIGLVNNMSVGAVRATQEQFARLLRAACPEFEISLALFRSEACRSPADAASGAVAGYRSVEDLFSSRLDAVIVTGMEPQAVQLQDEPAWDSLTRIVDRAQAQAVPVIWSCLAAHAAVFHLDGIRRARLPAKLSGVYDCDLVDADHPLAEHLPGRWTTPHSRYNDLSEDLLVQAGYEILSRSREAGVDSFTRCGPAPFLFCQGHPEYAAGALAAEYMRDVRRYLSGQRDEYPLAPRNAFDASVEAALDAYRGTVLRGRRDPDGLREVLQLVESDPKRNSWHRPAVRLYANWIARAVLAAPDRHPGPLAAGRSDAGHAEPALVCGC